MLTEPTLVPVITQSNIDALLLRLKELREQTASAREAIAPLEANLALTYDEFQAVVGRLRRQAIRLQAEIATLRAQIDGVGRDQDESSWQGASDDGLHYDYTTNDLENEGPAMVDPEAVEKDMLLEHLFRVLDPDINDEDADLLSSLQGLLRDPAISLADMLEELDWGPVWMSRGPQEDLADQYRRLMTWERAFTKQLESLNRATERLRKDPRYGLWQQREKGPDNWRTFLDQAARQQQADNDALQAELKSLREQWTQIVSET